MEDMDGLTAAKKPHFLRAVMKKTSLAKLVTHQAPSNFVYGRTYVRE